MANTRITQGVIKPNEDYDVRHINATGIITAQNISIGGTLTYNDVTNVDSIGVITARSGILIGAGQSIGPVSGIITYYGDGSKLSGIDATKLVSPTGSVKIQGYETGAVHTGFSTMQNLRVTGIATFGTSSTVINGDQNIINVGTALTLGHTQGLQFHTQNLHADGFEINNINASGIITASQFSGSGAGLSGMPVAIGTALGAAGSGLDAFFYVNKVLPVTSTVTVDPPSSSDRAYTHYTDIQVSDSADLIIAEGDDLIPDVLGLANNGTFGGGSSAGRLRVNLITDKDATGAPTVSNGLIISGVTTTSDIKVGVGATLNVYGGATFSGIVTASSFSGDGSNLTGIQVGGATSLSFNDNVGVYFGQSNDLQLYHQGNSNIKNITGYLRLLTDNFSVMNEDANQIIIKGNNDDGTGQQGVQLYYGGNQKFTTTNTGAVVSGILTATESHATAFVPTTGQLSHRNIITNGDFRINQRGSSSTSSGFKTVDRFAVYYTGTDENPTQVIFNVDPPGAYHLPTTGPHPRKEGFRKAFGITNGNQTSGAGAGDYIYISHKIEAQDMAQCGWDYTDANSFITLSFWVKSSAAQNFYGYLKVPDSSTAQHYAFETGALTAFTWKKVIVKIPGNSNLVFDFNTAMGLEIVWSPFFGTDSTSSSASLNTWGNLDNSARMPDYATGWYTTNDASFQITGVQLEVGPVATPFEHRSRAEQLARCQRYFQLIEYAQAMARSSTNTGAVSARFVCEMRTSPTISTISLSTGATNVGLNLQGDNSANTTQSSGDQGTSYSSSRTMYLFDVGGFSGMTGGRTYVCGVPANNAVCFTADAEM